MKLSDFWKILRRAQGNYPVTEPPNLRGRIESLSEDTVTYKGSTGMMEGEILADEGKSVIVKDKRSGWLRLWK